MTVRPPEAPAADPGVGAGAALVRFDATERVAHWATALLVGVLVLTGAALRVSLLMSLVGNRRVVELTHLVCGLALPLPVLASLAGPWGAAMRADLRRTGRLDADDRSWLRAVTAARPRRAELRAPLTTGKFNAGQKLNTAFTGGWALALLLTGVVMYWYHPWPLAWRTGATATHDWLSLAVVVVVAGHVAHALADPAAMRSMVTGRISRSWAELHAPGWLGEAHPALDVPDPPPGPGSDQAPGPPGP